MQRRDSFEQFQKFLNATNSDFQILEYQVPVETQMEYFNYSNHLRSSLPDAKKPDFEQLSFNLFNPESSLESKKQILSSLAITRQAKAYRIIEKYIQSDDKELTDWAHMALMENRIALESELSDERQIYISSGLGGKGYKLRFYILLLSSSVTPFLDYQRKVIEREFTFALNKDDGEIEELTIKDNYVEIILLMPIQSDIRRLVEDVIAECNQYGDFISNAVMVTNVKKLTENEIAQIIKRHEDI